MKFFEMQPIYKLLGFLCVLCASVLNCFALDREAFTITNYDLKVQVEPEQHRLGARGKITLRNDTQTPQKLAVLQVSSSLDWRSVRAGDKAVQFVTQPYASDIDHTGGLSEAIVTLPQAVMPQGTIDLEIAYEGTITLDATRLTRIDTPVEAASSTDWDEISPSFTAVRGVGNVAWYPIATEVANLSEGNSLFEVLGRWRARESRSKMHLHISVSRDDGERPQILVVNQGSCQVLYEAIGRSSVSSADCTYQPLGLIAPLFVAGTYGTVDRPSIRVYNLTSHAASAEVYAEATEKVVPLVTDWFGAPREKAQTADLADHDAAAFESGALLLTPISSDNSKQAGLAAAHQLTHAAFSSFRPWIEEGLAHFAQALYVEREKGRPAAIEYMGLHRSALGEIEATSTVPRSEDEANRSLVNTTSEELYRSKAMYVWWMLRDMVGEAALKKAIAAYRPEQDKEPSYMQRLIAAQTQRDVEWFFDDWVYRDRGLPDFKVESAFPRKTLTDSFMVTITVDNLGAAGAEVPVIVKFKGGEVVKRLEVRAKDKAVIRIEVPTEPQEIVVNDGSVPESNTANNTFKLDVTEK
jgi:hypothetical protein